MRAPGSLDPETVKEVLSRPVASTDAVEEAVALLGLEAKVDEMPADLTQGQRKLVGVARTLAAQRKLVAQLSGREVDKVYLAIVSGFVEEDGEVDLPLGYDRRRHHMSVVKPGRGKPARS